MAQVYSAHQLVMIKQKSEGEDAVNQAITAIFTNKNISSNQFVRGLWFINLNSVTCY